MKDFRIWVWPKKAGSGQKMSGSSQIRNPASREPTLDNSELEEALAYIKQKKEGLIQGRENKVGKGVFTAVILFTGFFLLEGRNDVREESDC